MGNACSALCNSKDDNQIEKDLDNSHTNGVSPIKKETHTQHMKTKRKFKEGNHGKYQNFETGSTTNQELHSKIKNESTGYSSSSPQKHEYSIKKNEKKNSKKMSTSDFDFLKYLGRGTFGKVALVKKKNSGHLYAMKILKKKDFNVRNTVENAVTEKEVLMKSHHPFVVKLRYSFQDETSLYFCMDYVEGGELFKYLKQKKRFTTNEARFYSAEVLLALSHLHVDLDTIYRDLKPENILIAATGHIKLTDFGLSKMGSKTSYSFCGTPEYLAPEIILNQGHTKLVDFWTFGCLIFEMLTGAPPFRHQNQSILYSRIKSATYQMPEELDEDAKSVISSLLQSNPRERLGFNGIEEIKKHVFFKKINFDKLMKLQIPPSYVPKLEKLDHSDDENKIVYKPTPGKSLPKIEGITFLGENDAPSFRKAY